MVEQITFIATILSVYGIAISCILILRSKRTRHQQVIVLIFTWSLISYLLLALEIRSVFFFELLKISAFLLPFSFWKLSKSIFSDDAEQLGKTSIEALIVMSIYLGLITLEADSSYKISLIYTSTMKLISISFLILSIVESQKGKAGDLIKSRLKLRKVFVYFVAISGLITILTEPSIGTIPLPEIRMTQRMTILAFTSYFLVINSTWREQFLSRKVKAPQVKNQGMVNRINELMHDQRFYKKEGLTIGKLSEELNEQEYKLRSVINQEMGYRNFPGFVNSFRIAEAKELLMANLNMTIQEVAFETGFNSIGPFNRAFKTETGLTPKVFRDQNGRQS